MEGSGSYQGLFWEGGSSNTMVIEQTSSSAAFGSRPAVGQWFFWAISCAGTAGGDLKGYWALPIDAAFTKAQATGSGLTTASIDIGNDPSSERIDGRLAFVRCWDAVLTENELWCEMHGFPRRTANINFRWDLWSSGDVQDYSGNGRNPTVGGTFTTEDGPVTRCRAPRRRRSHVIPPPGFLDDHGLVVRRFRTLRVVN